MDPINKYEFCRLCLQSSQSLVDIFEENVEHGFIIKDAIEDLMQFQVTQEKGVPWMACSRCLVKLNDFRLFKIQCIDSKLAFETKISGMDLPAVSCHSTFDTKYSTRAGMGGERHHPSLLDPFGLRIDIAENHIRQDLYPEVILKTMDEHDGMEDTPTTSCNYPVVDSSSASYVNSTKECENLESKVSNSGQDMVGVRKRIRRPRKKKVGHPRDVSSFLSSEIDITRVRVELRRQLEGEPDQAIAKQELGSQLRDQLMQPDSLNSSVDPAPSLSLDEWNTRLCADAVGHHGTLDVCGIVGSAEGEVLSASLVGELLAEAETKPFVCEYCNKVYGTRGELVRHSRSHSGERPYLCDICGISFARRYHLVQHKMIHTGEKPFRCENCDKCFSKSSHLNRHRRTHTGERPYSCLVCGKSFSLNYNLNAHMKVHQQEGESQEDLPCPHCDKTFTYKHNLVQHLKRHSASVPRIEAEPQLSSAAATCPDCGMVFPTKGDLARHTSAEHSRERPYCCIECLACFADELELARHSARHRAPPAKNRGSGPRRFACEDCDKGFNRRSRLLRHMASVHTRLGIPVGTTLPAALAT